MLYTTADLLTGVKQKALLPDSQSTFTDASILKLADEKIKASLVPAVLATREDYYLTSIDYTVNSNSYDIPSDAIGMKIARAVLVDTDGAEWPLVRVANVVETYESPDRFYIQKNSLYFDTVPTKTVRIYYHVRPLTLTPTTSAMKIVSIANDRLSCEVNSVPSSIVALSEVNCVAQYPGYETVMEDTVIDTIVGTTLTFSTELPSECQIGDYLNPKGYSAIPQIPCEMQVALEWMIASAILKSLGDAQGSTLALQESQGAIKDALSLLQPRVDGQSKKIVNRDSLLRQSSDYYTFGIYVK